MSNNLRKNNAITLVALIITIIILLILAGISIQIISQNNLFYKAKLAKKLTEISNEKEAIQLEVTLSKMEDISETLKDNYLGTPLYDKTLENGNKWNVIIMKDDKTQYGTGWNYIPKNTEISNYGNTQYNWLINYKTGEIKQIEENSYIQLMYGCNLAVKDKLMLNIDPINMEDSTSWGDGVKLYGVKEEDGYGWNGTEIKFDGVDDYIEIYNSFEAEDGITFEFYAKNQNSEEMELPMLSKSLPEAQYSGIRAIIVDNVLQLSMSMLNSESEWIPNTNLRHWVFKETNQDFQLEGGGYITVCINVKDSIVSLYSEGNLIGSTKVSSEWIKPDILKNENVPFLIGKRYGYLADRVIEMYGRMDIYACRLYNKVLNEEEIKENYNKTVAYHNMITR